MPLRDWLEVVMSPRVPPVVVPGVLERRYDAPLTLVLWPSEHYGAVEGRQLRRGILVVFILLGLGNHRIQLLAWLSLAVSMYNVHGYSLRLDGS